MDYTTQRGILQLIIGVCCAMFAMSMFVRSWRHDTHGWPIPWRMLVAIWIASLAWSFLAHALLWLEVDGVTADHWKTIAPLYAICVMSLWTFYRWLTKADGYAKEQRAEGVIEGHAAGVADEKHDQHEREMAV